MGQCNKIKDTLAVTLSKPRIDGLNAYDEVDLAALGSDDLYVHVNYTGIKLNDTLMFSWWGADAEGKRVDLLNSFIEVDSSNFDPVKEEVRVPVLNRYLVDADQGYAFCEYDVTFPAHGNSPRSFCMIGVRPHRMEHMPVAQAVDSHDLHIDPDTLGSAGALFIIAPYQAMRIGDDVKLIFQGFTSAGAEPIWQDKEPVLVERDIGEPIRRTVPKSEFDWLGDPGSYAEVYYEITFAGAGIVLKGPVQTFQMGPAPDTRLPPLTVDGYSGGLLNPVDFPDGLVIQVPRYADLHASDWLILHAKDQPAADLLRTDLSNLDSGRLQLKLSADVLLAVDRLLLSYQYAREGRAMSSQPLEIELEVVRDLKPALVELATAEDGGNAGRLAADDAVSGAYVNVPPVTLRPDEFVEVHWAGRSPAGTYITRTPAGTWPWRFKIPATAVAANMETIGAPGNRQFPVFYRIVKPGSSGQQSPDFRLRIIPLAMARYPQIRCLQASGTTLPLKDIPAQGAVFELDWWAFMAPGQNVNIVFKGVKNDETALVKIIRAKQVSEDEMRGKLLVETLELAVLKEHKVGEVFEVSVRVDFENHDDKDNYFDFSPLRLTLVG